MTRPYSLDLRERVVRAVQSGQSCRVGGHEAGPIVRKSRALLRYLAMSETGEESRDRLVGLLWSESEDKKARASLREA